MKMVTESPTIGYMSSQIRERTLEFEGKKIKVLGQVRWYMVKVFSTVRSFVKQ